MCHWVVVSHLDTQRGKQSDIRLHLPQLSSASYFFSSPTQNWIFDLNTGSLHPLLTPPYNPCSTDTKALFTSWRSELWVESPWFCPQFEIVTNRGTSVHSLSFPMALQLWCNFAANRQATIALYRFAGRFLPTRSSCTSVSGCWEFRLLRVKELKIHKLNNFLRKKQPKRHKIISKGNLFLEK